MKSKEKIHVAIVEDDKVYSKAIRRGIENSFDSRNLEISNFETGEQFFGKLNSGTRSPQVLILDHHLDSKFPFAMDGSNILKRVKVDFPNTEVIVLTHDNASDLKFQMLEQGAFQFFNKKDFSIDVIQQSLSALFNKISEQSQASVFQSLALALLISLFLLFTSAVVLAIAASMQL